jgi:hypothetical protein
VIHFWKWLGVSAGGAAVAYGALIAASGLAIPWRPEHFDTHVVNETERGWVNEARYFVLNKDRFAEPGNRVTILGASNARDPFRPDLMETRLPGWQVANASLSGAAIGEIADAVDLYYLERESGADGRTVFVVCLNYLQFLPQSGEGNPLTAEALRGGLHERRDGRLQARYPEPVEHLVEAAFRPQAVAASLPNQFKRAVLANPDLPAIKNVMDRFRGQDPLSRWTEAIGEARDLNRLDVPPDVQAALMAQRRAGLGGDRPIPASEFARLAALIDRIRARGDAIVVLDLPLPDWHRAGLPIAEATYSARLRQVLAPYAGDPSVGYLSLREYDAASNFFDSAHTKPRMWPVMSVRLADALASMPAVSGAR